MRLGETDLSRRYDCKDLDFGCHFSSEEKCLEVGACAEQHVVRRVYKQTMHPRYNYKTWVRWHYLTKIANLITKYLKDHDVGLVTLDQGVTISDFIRPVCLPSVPGTLDRDLLWFVTGWGVTTNKRPALSTSLQQVQVSNLKD